jgi:glycosyltransferase involved in cell wall biosynthesis
VQDSKRIRLGVLVSHPIQYYSPWFRHLATLTNLTVYYAHRQGAKGQAQAGFGVEFEWDVPLLDGYDHQFLQNVSKRPGLNGFFGCDTPEIARYIRGGAFDAFLCIGWNRKCYWQAMFACRKSRVPILMRGDSQLGQRRSLLKSWLKEAPYRLLLPRIDAHLYVGQRNKEYLIRYGVRNEQLFYCPHFVDNAHFAGQAEESQRTGTAARIRENLGIDEADFVALFVGKFIAKKRPLDVIEAIRRIAKSETAIHAIFVGAGPLETQCRQAAKDLPNIHFVGFQNQSSLPAYYRAADALVLPSDGDETWGLVVNESMACGTSSIISDACGCAPDMVSEGSPNRCYSCGDLKSLSEILESMAKIATDRRDAFRIDSERFVSKFSFENATSSLMTAIATISQKTDRPHN